jgi:uncharacterized membrane protein YtjA (UPF0391 family)
MAFAVCYRCLVIQSFFRGDRAMLRYAIFFFLLAVVAGLFGFTGLEGAAANIAQFLFFLFVAIWIVLLTMGFAVAGYFRQPPA